MADRQSSKQEMMGQTEQQFVNWASGCGRCVCPKDVRKPQTRPSVTGTDGLQKAMWFYDGSGEVYGAPRILTGLRDRR